MPSITRLVIAVGLVGCTESPPAPDVSNMHVEMRWVDDARREITVSIVNRDIPCDDVDHDFLGEEPVECDSGPWELAIDGQSLPTNPIRCKSAYDDIFGHHDKHCDGGETRVTFQNGAGEDAEIVATSDGVENRFVVPGVRKTYSFVQESSPDFGTTNIIRVDDLDLVSDDYLAVYAFAGHEAKRDSATSFGLDAKHLQLAPIGLTPATYDVRILVRATQPGFTIAVPVEGKLTIE